MDGRIMRNFAIATMRRISEKSLPSGVECDSEQ